MIASVFVLLPILWPGVAVLPQPTLPPAGVRTGALSTVFVRDESGSETVGKLLRLDERSVVMLVDDRQFEFDLARVWSVQKRGDSLKNGAIVGASIGLALALIANGMADCGYDDCDAGARMTYTAVSTGIYTLIGVGVDALVPGRTTLYQRPIVSSAARPTPRVVARLAKRW
jgi:hypothetical protein